MAYLGALLGILELSMLLIVGKLGEESFSKMGMIPFVGAIVLGIIVGPGLLGLMTSSPYIEEFTSLGIVFILFMAGIEDKPRRVLGFKKSIGAGLFAFGASFAVLTLAFMLVFGLKPLEASVIAVVLGMVSAGPFSRTLQETKESEEQASTSSRLFIEVMTMEVSAIVLFAFISSPSSLTSFTGVLLYAAKVLLVILAIMGFGTLAARPVISALEDYLRTREATFSVLVGLILAFGFLAQYVGFNSAIAAFLLGTFMSDEVRSNAYLLEKLRAITYGFFEPMFFMGLGLYFTRISASLLLLGAAAMAAAIGAKLAVSYGISRGLDVDPIKNFFAMSHEGGVDGAVLLTALSLSLISPRVYSFSMIAVTALAIIGPLGYQRGLKVESPRPTPSIDFVKYELKNVTALELANTLSTVSISSSSKLTDAVYALEELHTRVLIVVDEEGRPLGYVNDHELLRYIEQGKDLFLSDVKLHDVPKIDENAKAESVLDVFEREEVPVIAVVDSSGILVGSILEREVLRYLLGRRTLRAA